MTETTADEAEEPAPDKPGLDDLHRNSWSVNLETPAHAEDRNRIIDEAATAVRRTAAGYHVNLVTHGAHGHPSQYLWPIFTDRFDGGAIDWEYVDQCGCGGHVTRVHVRDTDR